MFGRILLAAMLAAGLAAAQRGGGDPGGGGDMGGGGGAGGGRGMGGDMGPSVSMRRVPQSKSDQIADKLKLDKAQKEDFQNILSAGREEANPLREKINQARMQLASALISGKSEAELKPLLDACTALNAQMTGIEAKAFAKLYSGLKPNQQNKAPQAFELMAGIFDQGMGGGMGAGRGMGGGRGAGR